jgi:hypothetical protein
VPNEIVIEAMIKGLRPGPTAQYFARKPPQTLEKLLQKMDEYIWADNDFRQRREEAYRFSEMTRGFGGESIQGMSDQSITPTRVMIEEARFKGHSIAHNPQGNSKALSGHQPQGAGVAEASEEGMGISPEGSIAYFVVNTRATLQEHARLPFRNKRRLPKQRRGRISRSRSYILLHAILPTYQNTLVINLWLLLLRQVIHKLLGLCSHYHHHCHLLTLKASSQKGTSTPNSSATSGRSPKLVQSIALY